MLSNGSASRGIPLPSTIVGHVPCSATSFCAILTLRRNFAALLLAIVLQQIHETTIARGFPVAATASSSCRCGRMIPLFPPFRQLFDHVPQESYFTSASVRTSRRERFPSSTQSPAVQNLRAWSRRPEAGCSSPCGEPSSSPKEHRGKRANTGYAYAEHTSTIATALSDLYAHVPPNHQPWSAHTMRQELFRGTYSPPSRFQLPEQLAWSLPTSPG